jgi:hypothetical protein
MDKLNEERLLVVGEGICSGVHCAFTQPVIIGGEAAVAVELIEVWALTSREAHDLGVNIIVAAERARAYNAELVTQVGSGSRSY